MVSNCSLISEFGISFAHASGVIRDKQAFSAAEVAREEYFFCGPSPGMFLFIPCLSRITSEISHGSLLTARFRTRLLMSPYMLGHITLRCRFTIAGAIPLFYDLKKKFVGLMEKTEENFL